MSDYLLGYDTEEWVRLERQHALWGPILRPVLERAGLRPGARVLDAGCGIGVLLEDLAAAVGPEGRAVGIEVDPRSAEAARIRVPGATVRRGDLRSAHLGADHDLVVSRWVLAYLPDAAEVVGRLARALRPGGALVVQDYHHDGISLFPDDGSFMTVVEAVREVFRQTGGDLWLAGRLAAIYAAADLRTEAIVPEVLAGGPGSGVWGWITSFLRQHAPGLVERGVLVESDRLAFEAHLDRAAAMPGTTLFSPMVVSVLGRRPGGSPPVP